MTVLRGRGDQREHTRSTTTLSIMCYDSNKCSNCNKVSLPLINNSNDVMTRKKIDVVFNTLVIEYLLK